MSVPFLKDNASGDTYRDGRGATPHLRHMTSQTDALYIAGKSISLNKDRLHKYFPIIVGRSSKHLFMLLLIIFSNPLRSTRYLTDLCLGNYTTTNKNLNILVDMGYIQVEDKPRKIIPFDAYTMDKVFRITRKGVRVLSLITGY
jgi:hypothetical protein